MFLAAARTIAEMSPAKHDPQANLLPPLVRSREQRDLIVHLVTHAALHVPRPLVVELRREAHIFGVFILPSGGKLDLDYIDLLDGHAVVDHATLQQKRARAEAATKIVDLASKVSERVSIPPPSVAPRTRDDALPPSLRAPKSAR